jgi:inhibitor of KinA sporulation pathway (predicted exonuclease)
MYIIFDLEATCYNKESKIEVPPKDFVNEIIEIGAVKLNEKGEQVDMFSKFSKPKLFPYISNFCTLLTTITQEDIDSADDLKSVLKDFMDWCEGGMLISWGGFDKNQISKDLIRNDLEIYLDKLESHKNLKKFHGEWNGLNKKKGVGLSKALNYEGLKFKGTHHRGIDDAFNISEIFKKYMNKF